MAATENIIYGSVKVLRSLSLAGEKTIARINDISQNFDKETTLAVTVQATKEEIFARLADYDRYLEWATDILEATILEQEGDIVCAQFVSPLLKNEEYVFEIVHNKTEWHIKYHQVGNQGCGLSGEWKLTDTVDGTEVKGIINFKPNLARLWRRIFIGRKIYSILQRQLEALRQIYSPPLSA